MYDKMYDRKHKAIMKLFLLIIFLLFGCGDKNIEFSRYTRFYMNTFVTIKVPQSISMDIIEKGFDKVEKWDNLVSESRGKKDIPKKLIPLIKESLEIALITDGAYDPTLYPLIELWKGYKKNNSPPVQEEIKEVLKNIGFKKISISADKITIPDGMGLDLGGFAKGWIVDKLVDFLKESGVSVGMIDAGGDIRVWGDKVWKIGIRNPFGNGLAAVINIKNKAVATSGDYENFFIAEGVKYHHILDPQTGYPADKLRSVTVITDRASVADGFSTALFVMGKNAVEAIEKENCLVVIFWEDGKYYTKELDINWLSYDKK